jgi:3-hydroxybutyryl-CoA dehydratase
MTGNPSFEFSLDQRAIDTWAELSSDRNPLHVDPAYAEQTPFEGTIAHGHLTLALLTHMFVRALGSEWLSGGAFEDMRFRAPVRPGHRYTAAGTEEPGDSGRRRWRMNVVAADGTTCVEGWASLDVTDGPA